MKPRVSDIVRDRSTAAIGSFATRTAMPWRWEELKASQEEIKRMLARVSEQNLPKTSPPPTQPTPTLRKPERTLQSPHARARPRIPREWIYEEW
jgi:hypothetical protein